MDCGDRVLATVATSAEVLKLITARMYSALPVLHYNVCLFSILQVNFTR